MWILTTDFKVYMERQNTQESKHTIEGEEQSLGIDTTQLQYLV